MKKTFEKITSTLMIKYIEFVYATSDVKLLGQTKFLESDSQEKVIAVFWHGDSYCLYPALNGKKLCILTTQDKRGDYITNICNHFGYRTIRIPDNSDGKNHLFRISRIINKEEDANLAIALDGPLGPIHVAKDFTFFTSIITKRKLVPVSFSIRHKIELKKRWDNYKIPLPFNKIVIRFNAPLTVTKEDKKDDFIEIKEKVVSKMMKNEK